MREQVCEQLTAGRFATCFLGFAGRGAGRRVGLRGFVVGGGACLTCFRGTIFFCGCLLTGQHRPGGACGPLRLAPVRARETSEEIPTGLSAEDDGAVSRLSRPER